MAQDIRRRNNVTTQGVSSGRTVLFAHGFGSDQLSWRHVAQDVARDHQVVLFDYVGCGHSDAQAWSPERYHTLAGHVQDLLDVCDALDLSRVTLVVTVCPPSPQAGHGLFGEGHIPVSLS